MQSHTWISLLRRIPAVQQNGIVIMTSVGTEMSIQSILRTEEYYLVFRGRMSATTDAGRLFFVPYDQIIYLGLQKEATEVDLQALYGDLSCFAFTTEPQPEPETAPAEDTATGDQPAADLAPAEPQDERKSGARLSLPGKEAILKRLRARSNPGLANKPPST